MRTILGLTEKWFVVFVLLFATAPLVPLFRTVEGNDIGLSDGDPLMQIVWLLIYLVSFFFISLRWKRFVYFVSNDKLLLLLLGLALVSVLWSAVPWVTLRRSLGLLATSLFGTYLAMRYGLKEQLQLLAWALGIAALLSLVFAVALPTYGIDWSQNEAWRGIYHQKNVLGRHMSLSAIVFLINAISCNRYRWIPWFGFGLSAGLTVLSTSKNALVAFLITLLLLPVYRTLRWHYKLKVPFLTSVILLSASVATCLLSNMATILNVMGKDTSLTGRTQLWAFLFEKFKEHLWLGYGYSGFWIGREGESGEVWSLLIWRPTHSHNGFLQLALDLGLLGLVVFMFSFLKTCLRAVTWVRVTKTAEGLWPLTYLALMFLSNLAESGVMSQQNLLWILYVAIVNSMAVQRDLTKRTSHISKNPSTEKMNYKCLESRP